LVPSAYIDISEKEIRTQLLYVRKTSKPTNIPDDKGVSRNRSINSIFDVLFKDNNMVFVAILNKSCSKEHLER